MNKDDLARATNPEGNRFELEPDTGFARALAQVDFSRGSRVRERVRARVLGKAINEVNGQQPGINWMKLSKAIAFNYWRDHSRGYRRNCAWMGVREFNPTERRKSAFQWDRHSDCYFPDCHTNS